MNEQTTAVVVAALREAETGVDYNAKTGATCPWCGEERLPVATTRPWQGKCRIRYHFCPNPSCLFYQYEKGIKSVQSA